MRKFQDSSDERMDFQVQVVEW
uniref:Uncharacterized protein n=1 Tax=Arundo donax TaxID=35708 RepID=A0A0A9FWA0_ARUDO